MSSLNCATELRATRPCHRSVAACPVGTGETTDTLVLPEPDALVQHLGAMMQRIKEAAKR